MKRKQESGLSSLLFLFLTPPSCLRIGQILKCGARGIKGICFRGYLPEQKGWKRQRKRWRKAGWGWLAGRDAKDGSSRKLSRSFSWGFLALHWGKEKAVDNTQAGCSGCIRQMAEGEEGREKVEGGGCFFYVAYRLYSCWQRHTFKRKARKQTQMRCFSPFLARHTKASSCTAHVKSPNHVHAIVLHIQAYYKCELELRKSSRPGRSYCISKRNCSEATSAASMLTLKERLTMPHKTLSVFQNPSAERLNRKRRE